MPQKKSELFNRLGVEAIAFDLDDTLWPCAPAIARAEKAYANWIEKHFPEVTDQYDATELLSMRRSLAEKEPALINDVTELRRRATQNLLQPFGASDSDVNEVMRVCLSARQSVTLYDDVADGLQKLSEHYQLGSITNGNANLGIIGIKKYFLSELAATMALPAKPAADMFIKQCEEFGVSPQAVLYVGDNPVNDVAAARAAKMKTAWINRTDEVFPADIEAADFVIADLDELAGLALSVE